jgi:hypothetical protein
MIDSLQLIKPKRLSDDLNVFIKDDTYTIDFGTSRVVGVKGGEKSPPCVISTKNLFGDNFEAANVIDNFESFIPPTEWHSIILNATDVNLFNSVASAGEDMFWFGQLTTLGKHLKVQTAGLVYFVDYVSPKLDLPEITAPIDYNFYYYMYQLFKGVTGKKLATLKITKINNVLIATDEQETFYIVSMLEHREFRFKVVSATQIAQGFVNGSYDTGGKTTRKARTADADSMLKHLSKFLGDEFHAAENKEWMKLYNMHGALYLGKKKVQDGT